MRVFSTSLLTNTDWYGRQREDGGNFAAIALCARIFCHAVYLGKTFLNTSAFSQYH